MKEVAFAPGLRGVVLLSGDDKGLGGRKPPGRFWAWRVFQIGLSREVRRIMGNRARKGSLGRIVEGLERQTRGLELAS